MAAPYKIHVKLGLFEFEAEGPEAVIKQQFAQFLEIAKSVPAAGATGGSGGVTRTGNGDLPAAGVPQEMMDRVFVVDAADAVSLRIIPRTQQAVADGLLVLLYGFRKLTNQNDVLSGRLMDAATTSGFTVSRVDNSMRPVLEYVTKGGVRSGSKWGLNNRGVTRSEELIREMVDGGK